MTEYIEERAILSRARLDALLEEKFPRIEPYVQRAPNRRGDDAAVDARDDERWAIDQFIDYMEEAGLVVGACGRGTCASQAGHEGECGY